ncbi:MAG: DUF2764 family protein [Bacteroidales bacterium]|nr:DUF2764 family protein [Bacteroidales bacterium]MBN2819688.1 DUF2764 family protein [Bacteroidales bacterium]
MSRQYYYLVAGLPDIIFDDKKIPLSTLEYRAYLEEHLEASEMSLLKTFFWRFDNKNVLKILKNTEVEQIGFGNLSLEQLDELFRCVKDGSNEDAMAIAPGYLVRFITAYKAETPIIEGKSWELQLSDLYYDYICQTSNTFINNWYTFEKNISNVLTALQCRKYEIDRNGKLAGKGEVIEKLEKSSSRDFGLSDEIELIDQIIKISEETDLLLQEQKTDLLKWGYLDENSFFHYFSIEKLFVFLIKLSIAERWISLDKETGRKLFEELLKDLETSYEFPEEFSLK